MISQDVWCLILADLQREWSIDFLAGAIPSRGPLTCVMSRSSKNRMTFTASGILLSLKRPQWVVQWSLKIRITILGDVRASMLLSLWRWTWSAAAVAESKGLERGGFLSAELKNRINGFFRRLYRYGYTPALVDMEQLLRDAVTHIPLQQLLCYNTKRYCSFNIRWKAVRKPAYS